MFGLFNKKKKQAQVREEAASSGNGNRDLMEEVYDRCNKVIADNGQGCPDFTFLASYNNALIQDPRFLDLQKMLIASVSRNLILRALAQGVRSIEDNMRSLLSLQLAHFANLDDRARNYEALQNIKSVALNSLFRPDEDFDEQLDHMQDYEDAISGAYDNLMNAFKSMHSRYKEISANEDAHPMQDWLELVNMALLCDWTVADLRLAKYRVIMTALMDEEIGLLDPVEDPMGNTSDHYFQYCYWTPYSAYFAPHWGKSFGLNVDYIIAEAICVGEYDADLELVRDLKSYLDHLTAEEKATDNLKVLQNVFVHYGLDDCLGMMEEYGLL